MNTTTPCIGVFPYGPNDQRPLCSEGTCTHVLLPGETVCPCHTPRCKKCGGLGLVKKHVPCPECHTPTRDWADKFLKAGTYELGVDCSALVGVVSEIIAAALTAQREEWRGGTGRIMYQNGFKDGRAAREQELREEVKKQEFYWPPGILTSESNLKYRDGWNAFREMLLALLANRPLQERE